MESPKDANFDVVVIGGGAAGIFAATAAAARGARTLLLERNFKVGIKVLASGGSRCNVTSVLPVHELCRHFGRAGGRFLGQALKVLPPESVVRMLHEEGVETYEEKWDKVFPTSNKATDVLAAFLRRLARAGAEIRTNARVREVSKREDGTFTVQLEDGALGARRIIVATGGKSYPKTGSTGDGYSIAVSFGHTLVKPRPALVPLVVDSPRSQWVRELSGIAFQDVIVKLVDASGKTRMERRRPLLFTHFGLSAAGAMDVSRELDGSGSKLLVDFAPETPHSELVRAFDSRILEKPRMLLREALPLELPDRCAEALLKNVGVDPTRRAGEASKNDCRLAIEALKATAIDITGTLGFDKAEVTAGGVTLDEVDPRTMESRRCPGLYFCGEVLDVDGPIGGFNFQAAFSTGHVAGEACATAATTSRWM